MRIGLSKVLGRSILLAAALSAAVPVSSFANPPPWAPAHGWRKKNDPNYEGYQGRKWEKDYGVVQGRCVREAAGAAVGAAIGGAVGSQVGGGDGRKVAIVVGAVLGGLIGAKIGRDMDRADRACIGHALELAGDKRSVSWDADGVAFLLTPRGGYERDGQPCRRYSLSLTVAGTKPQVVNGAACRSGDGVWQVVS